MNLIALPAFDDNYVWMLHDGACAVVVDPGDAVPVCTALEASGLHLAGILVTHHHGDHVGGLADLRAEFPDVAIHAPAGERMPVPVQSVRHGDRLELLGLEFQVLHIPGHTAGHVAYYVPAPETTSRKTDFDTPLLFCGDTLFSGGCGRIFEGSPSQMHASLSSLASLPASTQVCCAHEYTLSNLRFARTVDPDNPELAAYETRCRQRRAQGLPTLPSTLGLELQINPFLRCSEPAVIAAARTRQPTVSGAEAVFAVLRQWKNDYR